MKKIIMKKTVLFFILSLCLIVKAQDKNIEILAANGDFIQLSHLDIDNLVADDPSIPLLRAYTYSAMARYGKSNKELEFLLGIDSVAQNPQLMLQILPLQANNYFKNYQYKQAAESYKKILDNYGDLLRESMASVQDVYRRYNALSAIEPLQVDVSHDTKIATIPDKRGLPLVQVRTPKDSVSVVFDTGASLSCVTKSVAKRLGIRILADSLIGGGAAGHVEFMSIGVSDTLYLGDILYKNVLFLVFEDEKFTFPEHGYAVNGTFGFPEMQILSALKIHRNGILEISKNTDKRKSNMMFTSSNQIVVLANDSILFWLDTGAAETNLSVNYYNKNKEQTQVRGQLDTKTITGMGGSKEISIYKLKKFPIKVGAVTTILPKISVFTEPSIGWTSEYDGSLGQDVISQYDYILLDFRNMYFSLENIMQSK